MNDYFNGKVALVTGAAMGMGYAGAQAFAEAGGRGGSVRRQRDRRAGGV